MSTPEQHVPPVYGCAAGAVLHVHAASTLEPAVLLHTFLPAGAADRLHGPEVRVDVHGDGPGTGSVTVRALSEGQSLSWSLPVAPFVAALPGQPGDEGRMVLLAVVDAEPEPGFWARAVDCEQLAAELQLPVADLADALRGQLTPWLADDLEILLHDDAHEHAADQSPAQTLAAAVLAHYRSDLTAAQSTNRLVRALEFAPEEFQLELAGRLSAALVHAVRVGGPERTAEVLAATGPFETEALRLLTELPEALSRSDDPSRTATEVLLAGGDRDETVRAAVSVVARLARAGLGPDLPPEQVLQRLGMVDDAGLARLARLWVDLAAATEADLPGLAARVADAGAPGGEWLLATSSALASLALDVAGRQSGRLSAPLDVLGRHLEAAPLEVPAVQAEPVLRACLELARFVRARGGVGAGAWLSAPALSAAQAVGQALAEGTDRDVALDLLLELLESDVESAEVLDALVCATSQVLVHLDPHEHDALRAAQVAELLSSVPGGPRGVRWLLVEMLRQAPEHDTSAADLRASLPDVAGDADRAVARLGRRALLGAGLACLDALVAVLGEAAQVGRDEVLGGVLPSALAEHDLLRRA